MNQNEQEAREQSGVKYFAVTGQPKKHETEALEDYIFMQLCPLQNLFDVAPGMSCEDTARLFSVAETVFHDTKKRIEAALKAVREHLGVIHIDVANVETPDREVLGVSIKKLRTN